MKVKCKINDPNKIENPQIVQTLRESIHLEGADESLRISTIYPVICIELWNDGLYRVYLHTYEELDYPYPYPLAFFQIVDSSIPSNWSVVWNDDGQFLQVASIGPNEWLADDGYYEKLLDGDKVVLESYKRVTDEYLWVP